MVEQLDLELLSEDEQAAFKEVPPISDEPEPTSEEIKVEKEPSPPKIEEPPKEPAPVKVEPPKEPVKEPVKEPEPTKAPSIDGIIAKDGKNFIPFSVLEEERTKRQQLEAEVAELRKPKPPEPVKEPVREPVREPEKVEPPPIDFKALGKKLYESEDGAAEVLQQMFQAGMKAGEESGAKAGKSISVETEFQREVNKIRDANPWAVGDPDTEAALYNHALGLMEKRNVASDDLRGMVKAAEDAVAWGKAKFRIDEPKVDLQAEIDKAVKTEREKVTKEILAKFNIKEPEVTTLANVRNVNPDVTSKFDELSKLTGIDYEEAYGQLTPEEKEAFEKRLS